LGAIREIALVQEQVAATIEMQGHVEEARSIIRDQVLPIMGRFVANDSMRISELVRLTLEQSQPVVQLMIGSAPHGYVREWVPQRGDRSEALSRITEVTITAAPAGTSAVQQKLQAESRQSR
jgi:hypothetical protein